MSRLLTLDDLYDFYSKYKRSSHFDYNISGEPIVVQTKGILSFSESNSTDGLTPVTLQACHTEKNLNSSSISTQVMEKMLSSLKNRPILGYIHDVNGEPQFYGHNMHLDAETDEIVYDEIVVGIIPETNNIVLVHDDEKDRFNVHVDGYIFEEYTKASDILKREGTCSVSVEIAITQMSYNAKDKCLIIEDGYFSGVTILGVDENGNEVKPGMEGSNIKLKDFSQSKNSLFSSETEHYETRLIEAVEKLNALLSKFSQPHIEEEKEGELELENIEETLVVELENVNENNSENIEENVEETMEVKNEEVNSETFETLETQEVTISTPEETKTDTPIEQNEVSDRFVVEKTFKSNGVQTTLSFDLSHSDIRAALYNLVSVYESEEEWCWIENVYDTYFIMRAYSYAGSQIYGQKYLRDGDIISLDGERYRLHEELLTDSEKEELDKMRAEYSIIVTELNSYKERELLALKEKVFEEAHYSEFLNTNGFKELRRNINNYSLEELKTRCELQFAKEVKAKGTFSAKAPEAPANKGYVFGTFEKKTTFLESLLKNS